MATQTYTDGVTLSAAAEFNRFDTVSYAVLSGVAGTNTITATGPANYTYAATTPPVWLIPANTITGAATINITPSGGSALGAKNIFMNGAACTGFEIRQNVPCALIYDGTQFNILGPTLGSRANFTPGVSFGGASVGVTYSSQSGVYSRIGALVFFTLVVELTSKGSSTGNAAITGLPFTTGATTHICTVRLDAVNLDAAGGYYSAIGSIGSSVTVITLLEQGDNVGVANITDADFGNTSLVRATGFYII